MKLLWTGSDVLYMMRFPPYIRLRFKMKILAMRVVAMIIQPFIQENYVDHELLKDELETVGFKNIKVFNDQLKYTEPFEKKPHKEFNILYYYPKGKKNKRFIRWLYGMDIIERLRSTIKSPRVKWIMVDGSQNMENVFPVIDFYVRPTRHDGASRLRQECKINNIPYYWSQTKPSYNKALTTIHKNLKNKDSEQS